MSMGGGGTSHTEKRLMGIDFQGAEYGNCVPVVFGRNKLTGNVIWYGDFTAIKHKEKTGGKGGGGSSNTTFTYTASFQVGLHEGVGSVNKVYEGTAIKTLADYGAVQFTGTATQAVWSHLAAPYNLNYSGTVHVDFQNLDLGSSASLPNFGFEVNGLNQFSGTIFDANPADIVTTICTDTKVGIGFGALGDLTQFSTYCKAAGIFFSPVYDQQQPASTVLEDLFKYANSAPFYSEGKLKVVPYCDQTITGNGVTFTPAFSSQADLGPGDFITNGTDSAIKVKRVNPTDAENIVRLEYRDRALDYRTVPVQATIDQDMIVNGVRATDSESVDMITLGSVARLVVQNLLQRRFYLRNQFEFQLPYRYCYLEPMDEVTLTEPSLGLSMLPVRILEIGEDEEGLLSVLAEEFPDGVGHGGDYAIEPPAGYKGDVNVDPGPITAPYLFRGPGFLATQPEIWCAVAAQNPLWGGCDVYISHDGTSYNYLTSHNREAKYGYVTNSMTAGTDLDNTNVPNVVLNGAAKLLGGSANDRDNLTTISMVDTELFSYQTSTLAAGPSYNLGSLRRGTYGTAITNHLANAPFVRLDDNILQIPIDPSLLGKTIWMKFVSYNCFGNGLRNIASETAYQYVVGSNVEFPDKPVAPSVFTVTPVADGVNLRWVNDNPAATAATSIEYGTSGTGPWTVLGQVGTTHTTFHHAFATGATYWYRIRSRGHQISAGWSAYSPILSSTGVATSAAIAAATAAAAAAQASADAANLDLTAIAADTILSKGEKKRVIVDWNRIFHEHAGIDAQATSYNLDDLQATFDSAYTALATYLTGLSPAWNDTTQNTTIVAATWQSKWGDYYDARQDLLERIADCVMYGADYVAGENLLPNPSFVSNRVGTPNNSFRAVNKAISDGWKVWNWPLYTADNECGAFWLSTSSQIVCKIVGQTPLAAGATRFAGVYSPRIPVQAGKTYKGGFNVSGSFNGTLPGTMSVGTRMAIHWYDGTGAQIGAWAVLVASGTRSGGGWEDVIVAPTGAATCSIDFGTTAVNNGASPYTHATSVMVASSFNNVWFRKVPDVEVAGSGVTIGDTGNLPSIVWGNGTAKVPSAPTYTATTTTATISVPAFTILSGSRSIAYGAKTVGVTGTSGQVKNYFLYIDDPTGSGTGTLVATTVGNAVFQADGRVYIGTITVTFAAGGSGGGSGGGQQGSCVCIDMELAPDFLAAEARMEFLLDCLDLPTSDRTFRRRIQGIRFAEEECVELQTEGGAVLRLSTSTPFDLLDGRVAFAGDMLGEWVMTDRGPNTEPEIDVVVAVLPLGVQPVARISVGGVSYAAGETGAHRIYSHNALKP